MSPGEIAADQRDRSGTSRSVRETRALEVEADEPPAWSRSGPRRGSLTQAAQRSVAAGEVLGTVGPGALFLGLRTARSRLDDGAKPDSAGLVACSRPATLADEPLKDRTQALVSRGTPRSELLTPSNRGWPGLRSGSRPGPHARRSSLVASPRRPPAAPKGEVARNGHLAAARVEADQACDLVLHVKVKLGHDCSSTMQHIATSRPFFKPGGARLLARVAKSDHSRGRRGRLANGPG